MTFLTQVGQSVVAMGTGVLAARLLGPEGRGELATIQNWSFLIVSVAQIGLPEAIVYFASRYPARMGEYLVASQILMALSGTILGALGWFLLPWVLPGQSPEIIGAARLTLLLIGSYILFGQAHQLLRALGAWRFWNVYRLLQNLSWLLLLLCGYVFPSLGHPIPLSQGYLLVMLLPVIPLLVVLRRCSVTLQMPRADCYGPMLRYGLSSVFSYIPQTLNLRLDQMLMATFLAPTSLGIYVVAVGWSGMLPPLVQSVGHVLFPHLSAIHGREQQRALLVPIFRKLGVVLIGFTALLLLITPIGLPFLFGSQFKASIPVALILVIAGGFSALNAMLSSSLLGLGRPHGVVLAECTGLCVTIVTLFFLLVPLGIIGAALASLFAYVATTLVLVFQIRRSWGAASPVEAVDGETITA